MKYEDAWVSVDPLGEALHFLRMDGIFYCRAEFSAALGLVLPPMKDSLMFHFVTSGRSRLRFAVYPPSYAPPKVRLFAVWTYDCVLRNQ